MTISATAATATVEYVDADGSLLDDADTGTAGHQVNVSVGITAIGILVTAPDGTALIHTINVERDSALFGGWTPTKDVHSLDPVADPYVQDIWSNGTTVWVANKTVDKLHAYTLANGVRYATRDVSLAATNRTAAGIWSDGTTIWVGDAALVLLAYPTAFHRIYSYNLPPYLEGTTTLSALTTSPSPAIPSFAPDLRPHFAFLTYFYRVRGPQRGRAGDCQRHSQR